MNSLLSALAFALGAAAIAWVGAGFLVAHTLALAVTVAIGLVYLAGGLEMWRFKRATATLGRMLAPPDHAASLDTLLSRLHPSLQSAVRLRIEGERVALPGPALTPYLVGLLVMLGMLGTFLGLVATLNGTVFALEGTTDLAAIRAGLAAPIKGLGLAFGTSVAGVAASAMLGLVSTLCRRERQVMTQQLDRRIAGDWRAFSRSHQRQETFRAMQAQAEALPAVVDKLHTLAQMMERMGQQLNDRLTANQESFHANTQSLYAGLARSIETSLKETLGASGRLAGESLRPLLAETMTSLGQSARDTQASLAAAVHAQMDGFAARFKDTATQVEAAWQAAISRQTETSQALLRARMDAETQWLQEARHTHEVLVDNAQQQLQTVAAHFRQNVGEVSAHWQSALTSQHTTQQALVSRLEDSLTRFNSQLAQTATDLLSAFHDAATQTRSAQEDHDRQRLQHWQATLQEWAVELKQDWQHTGEQHQKQQDAMREALQTTARQIAEHGEIHSTQTLEKITRLLGVSEQLIHARIAAEQTWVNHQREHMEHLAQTLRDELSQLREEEARRAQAAIGQLETLQGSVASHLATLGAALETPMTNLIQTAAEAPRAAAEVIAHLRQEITHTQTRDNELLRERERLMEGLDHLLTSLNASTTEQRAAVETLVTGSAHALAQVGEQFTAQLSTEAGKLTEIAAQVTGSAIDVSSLSEAFGVVVQQFQGANEKLIDNLQRIEASLEKSATRSDDQLAYYVAQAREVIDLSMLSQREILEGLRQLQAQPDRSVAEVEG